MNSTTLPPSAAASPSPSPSPLSPGEPPEANGSTIHVTHPGSTEAGPSILDAYPPYAGCPTPEASHQPEEPQSSSGALHVIDLHVTSEPSLTSTLHNTSTSSDFGTNLIQHTTNDIHSNERAFLEDTVSGSYWNGTTTVDTLGTFVGTKFPQSNVQIQGYPQPIFNGNGNHFLPNTFSNETGNNNLYCFGTIPQQVPFDNTITFASPVPQIGFTTGPQYTSLPHVDFNNQGYQHTNPTSLLQGNFGNMMYYTPSGIPLQYANFGTSNYQSPYNNAAPTNEFSNNGFVDNGSNNNGLNTSHFTPTSSNGSNRSNNPAPKPHTQRTRTQCPNCTETFSRKSDFERHHESVHLGIKYHCDFPGCHNNRGQGYCRAEKLKTHRREMHGVI